MTIALEPSPPPAQNKAVSDEADLPAPPRLEAAGAVSLFLDFDGTLVDIADHPQAVVVPLGLPGALAALAQRLDGRVAVVSGRSLAMLDQFLGGAAIAMAGSHGGEFRPAGAGDIEALADPLPEPVRAALAAFARDNGDLVFEPKPFSAAVHYRSRPACAPALLALAARLGDEHGLHLKHGKMVVEVSMPGSDKGNAVARFMDLPPFAGSRPLFVGDDVTDEDAFAAVRRFDGGGILVGPLRPTQALWRLDDVAAVHRWLEDIA